MAERKAKSTTVYDVSVSFKGKQVSYMFADAEEAELFKIFVINCFKTEGIEIKDEDIVISKRLLIQDHALIFNAWKGSPYTLFTFLDNYKQKKEGSYKTHKVPNECVADLLVKIKKATEGGRK